MPIFETVADHREFLDRLRRHLTRDRVLDDHWRPYAKLHDQVSVLAYGLMRNHFHLVIHQQVRDGVERLLQRALNGYGKYFNRRTGQTGPLFGSRYKASLLADDDPYRMKYAIAYTHLNDPILQLDHPWTSHRIYMGEEKSDWVDVEAGLALFGGRAGYVKYMNAEGPRIVRNKLKARGLDKDPTLAYRPITES
jgi:hypothetical protein